MPAGRAAAPLVLVANPNEVFARSLESVLAPSGFAVLHAHTARAAFEQERRARPDALILAMEFGDQPGLALCRAFRQDHGVTPSTPIFLTQASPATRPQRIQALRAGADELWGQPIDTEEFALRLGAQLRAKFDADRARVDSLVDNRSGLWNREGFLRRATELLARSARDRDAIAAVIVAHDGNGVPPDWDLGDRLAEGVRRATRLSDGVGRLSSMRFGIVATRTDAAASIRLCQRLLQELDRRFGAEGLPLRIGVAACDDGVMAPTAAELVERAMRALRDGAPLSDDARVRNWRA